MDDYEGYGNSQYGKEGGRCNHFKLKSPKPPETKTELVCRIFPAIKSMKDVFKGWRKYHAQHFGYSGLDQRDPSKKRARPFACIFKDDRKTKLVLQECPKCDEIDDKRKSYERLKAQGEDKVKAGQLSQTDLDESLSPFVEWLKRHNWDGKYYLNVMTTSEEFGDLAITGKCYGKLERLIDELVGQGINPLDLRSGVWFKFTRIGKGFQVEDDVQVVKEMIDAQVNGVTKRLEEIKPAPVTPTQAKAGLEIFRDLGTDIVRWLDERKIKMLMASSGDPEEVDRIWALGDKVESPNAPARQPVSAPATAPVQAAAPIEKAPPAEVLAEPAKEAAPTTAAVPKPSVEDYSNLEDDAFFEMYKKRKEAQPSK